VYRYIKAAYNAGVNARRASAGSMWDVRPEDVERVHQMRRSHAEGANTNKTSALPPPPSPTQPTAVHKGVYGFSDVVQLGTVGYKGIRRVLAEQGQNMRWMVGMQDGTFRVKFAVRAKHQLMI
jgi:hypothetical protein